MADNFNLVCQALGVRPFAQGTLFSGFIRCRIGVRPYYSKKVLRQLGHVQRIPRQPPPRPMYQLCDQAWVNW